MLKERLKEIFLRYYFCIIICDIFLNKLFSFRFDPLSVMTYSGTPNRAIQYFKKAEAIAIVVISSNGATSTHFVARSMQVFIRT